MADTDTLPNIATHGAERLPSVTVDSYNVELKDDEGFIGDRASKGAFRDMIENWRKPLRKAGDDPFGRRRATRSPRRSSMACSPRATPRRLASCKVQSRTFRRSSRW